MKVKSCDRVSPRSHLVVLSWYRLPPFFLSALQPYHSRSLLRLVCNAEIDDDAQRRVMPDRHEAKYEGPRSGRGVERSAQWTAQCLPAASCRHLKCVGERNRHAWPARP